MPPVKFDRIVSCSSEDPAYPAKNLLAGREHNRKWKSKEPGEESISVVIQLNQPYVITGIDIGNEGSSFVEVLVSRTSTPDDFQVLLLMSSFMTPMDARSESNKNRVRMFTQESLSDTMKKEKWDRIKVVCTQPFNKHFCYGLSFIVLHHTESMRESPVKPSSPVKKTLGRFALKDDDDDKGISVGSFFSRRKDLQTSPPRTPPVTLTGAAAVRDASLPANLAVKKRKGSDDLTDSQKKKRGKPKKESEFLMDIPASTSADKQTKINGSSSITEKQKKNSEKASDSGPKIKPSASNRETKEIKGHRKLSSDDDSAQQIDTPGSSQRNQSRQKQTPSTPANITYKPFNKLLEGVEFVLSGYINPERSEIRDKALSMGAKFSKEWTSSCTHLICAFPNTPKFKQVQGKGIIVTHHWVNDCHQQRKKLFWKQYATAVNERKDANSSSDPEVWELLPDMTVNNNSSPHPVSRRNNLAAQDTRLRSDSEDSEDEIERIRAKQNSKKKRSEDETKVACDEDAHKRQFKKKDTESTEADDFNGSTDVDSEEEARNRLTEWSENQSKASRENLPPLPDFFNHKTFYVSDELSESDKKSMYRYITAFGGEVQQSQEKSVHYVVSRRKCKLSEGARTICVTPEWIWECNDCQRLVSPSLYQSE